MDTLESGASAQGEDQGYSSGRIRRCASVYYQGSEDLSVRSIHVGRLERNGNRNGRIPDASKSGRDRASAATTRRHGPADGTDVVAAACARCRISFPAYAAIFFDL